MVAKVVPILVLVGVGMLGRLIPHPPNFTPVEAIALFGGKWIRPWGLSLGIPVAIMALSDWILGWHNLWPFTWGGMALGAILGRLWLIPNQILSVMGLSVLQSTFFFILTNFGVWAVGGYYSSDWQGLIACYLAAIPFYHYQVLGSLTYGGLFWALEKAWLGRLRLSLASSS